MFRGVGRGIVADLNKSTLEFQLRLQQFIELVRGGDFQGALAHSHKYLTPFMGSHFPELQHAAGILCSPPTTPRYRALYSPTRWAFLADLFTSTHHTLYSIPQKPLICIALSAGLSALKTPSCHAKLATKKGRMCPICSTELKELARGVPYAHHGRSEVEADPVVLPNGRVYGRENVQGLARRLGLEGRVRDPETGEEWAVGDGGVGEDGEVVVRKVYIM